MIRDVVFSLLAKDKTGRAVQSAERGLNRLQNASKRVTKALGGIKGVIAAGFVGAAMRSSAEMADQMEKLAMRLGGTTEALSQLRYGADLSGVSFEQLSMGLQNMTRQVAEAAQGTGKAQNALAELGIDAQALSKLKPEQQFEVIAEALSKVENQSDKVRMAFKLFGGDGVAMLQMMEGGAAGVRAFREEAEKLGITIIATDATALANMNDSWDRFTAVINGVVTKMTAALAPALEWTANFLTDILIGAINLTKIAFGGLKIAFLLVAEGITEGIAFLVGKLAALPRLLKEALSLGKDIPMIGDGFAGAASKAESLEKAINGYSESLSGMVSIADIAGDKTGNLSEGMKKLRAEATETDKAINKLGTGVKKVSDIEEDAEEKVTKLKDKTKDAFTIIADESHQLSDNMIKNFSDSIFGLGGGESFGENMKHMFAEMNSEILQNTMKNALYGGGEEGGGLLSGLFGGGEKSKPTDLIKPVTEDYAMGESFAATAGPLLGESFGTSTGGFFDNFSSILGTGSGEGFLGGLTNIFQSAGSSFSSLFSGLGSSLSGMLGGMGGMGGIASLAANVAGLFGGFFADGGTVRPGKAHIVGERGAEMFIPNTIGTIIPNAAMAAAPVNVTMNIHTPDARGFKASQSQIAADMARQMEKARRNL